MRLDLGGAAIATVHVVHPDTSLEYPEYSVEGRYVAHMEDSCRYLLRVGLSETTEDLAAPMAIVLEVDGVLQEAGTLLFHGSDVLVHAYHRKQDSHAVMSEFVARTPSATAETAALSLASAADGAATDATSGGVIVHFYTTRRGEWRPATDSRAQEDSYGCVGAADEKKRRSRLQTSRGQQVAMQSFVCGLVPHEYAGGLPITFLTEFGFASQHQMDVLPLPLDLLPRPKRCKRSDGHGLVGDGTAEHPVVCD